MSRFERCQQCPSSYECSVFDRCLHGDEKTVAERKWQAGLKLVKPQQPCDVGLFSDDMDQVEMFMNPTNDML